MYILYKGLFTANAKKIYKSVEQRIMALNRRQLNRRDFLKCASVATASFAAGLSTKPLYAGRKSGAGAAKKVIVIGIDGMDPILSTSMMDVGLLPNFAKLRQMGGYRMLGTSIPPQTPVAWSNFINGAGPGSHGIFDFIHRHPEKQCAPFFSIADTEPEKPL